MTLEKKRIVGVLKSLKLDGWNLLIQDEEKSALYVTKDDEIETVIDSRRISADVTIYKRYGEKLGDARFTIFDDDAEALRAMVADALIICSTAKKPAWPLPKPQRYPVVKLEDEKISGAFKNGETEKVNLALWQKIRAAAKNEERVSINSIELHLKRLRTSVTNSEGLDGDTTRTELFVEADFIANGGNREENEFHATQTVIRLKDFDTKNFVRRNAQLARDVLTAERFRGLQEGKIALTGDALRDFWAPAMDANPAVFHAGAQIKYRRLSRYELGKRITNNEGFTLYSDPLLPYNSGSSRFDYDGVASKRVAIAEKGIIKNYFASQRYGHYLKVEPTGGLGVIELALGKESTHTLLEDGTVEIVSFSSFSPNSVSGDFSAEIRLGYIRKNGKRIPVRAAMFSGNVFQMLDAMHASRETMTAERYKGPSTARFDARCRLAGF